MMEHFVHEGQFYEGFCLHEGQFYTLETVLFKYGWVMDSFVLCLGETPEQPLHKHKNVPFTGYMAMVL